MKVKPLLLRTCGHSEITGQQTLIYITYAYKHPERGAFFIPKPKEEREMDELYMGTEEPQTELETEPDALRDEPVVQTETVSDAPSAEDDMDPEGAAAGSHQSGTQRRRERRVRPAPVVSIDDRLGVETDADKARDAMLDLVESLKTRRILSGTVQGIERPGDGANSVAVIYHGDFKVLIPAEEMVEKPEETRGRSVSDAIRAFWKT